MEDQPKTERKNHLEQLQKMVLKLKNEKPSKDPAMTAIKEKLTGLRGIKSDLAFLKLTLLKWDGDVEEVEAQVGKTAAEKTRAELAGAWQRYTELEESLHMNVAHFESAMQEEEKTFNSHKCQSMLEKYVHFGALIADITCRLDEIVASLTPKEEGTSSENPEEEADLADDIFKGGEGTQTPLEEAETEDDIRLKALFAQMDRQIAQNKSVGTYVEFRALNDAFLRGVDERKAQRARNAEEEVQEST